MALLIGESKAKARANTFLAFGPIVYRRQPPVEIPNYRYVCL